MNAVETLEAAITKLEELKRVRFIYSGWLCEPGDGREPIGLSGAEEDVLPYRTIDAQLAILREAHDRPGWENGELAYTPHAVALAHAILGES